MPDPTAIPSRCWRLQAFTDYQQAPRIEFLRESIRDLGDGDVIHKPLPTVARTLAEVAATPIAGGPITCTTLGDLFNAVDNAGHQLAAEDDAAASARAQAEASADQPDDKG